MEKCPVCGQNCGITHSCPGPNAGHAAAIAQWKAPEGFAPLHYLRQALAIARLKEAAISAASQDENALIYGVTIWVVGQALIIAGSFLSKGQSVHTVAVVLGIGILIVMDAIAVVIQWGTCHCSRAGGSTPAEPSWASCVPCCSAR
jgi:hypothetical protein